MKLLPFLVFCVAVIVVSRADPRESPEYWIGRSKALDELRHGRFSMETYGLRSAVPLRHESYLQRHFGVRFIPVADCVITPAIANHARGYNEAMARAIDRKFGRGFLERTRRAILEGTIILPVEPNKSPEPTPTSVMPAAKQPSRRP